jgi:ankyrin repeat protein
MKLTPTHLLPGAICVGLLLPCHAGKIHDAVTKRDVAALDRALKQGPQQVDARCYPDFETPLYMAVEAGNPAIVKRLLDAGADLTLPSVAGVSGMGPQPFTPLQRAAFAAGYQPIKAGPDSRSGIAAGATEYQTSLKLLKSWAEERAAMPEAERAARLEVLALLLAKEPELNRGFPGGTPPLHLAAGTGNAAMVKLLIRSGANVNSRDDLWTTPLHAAAMYGGDRQAIEALVAAGADIEASDKQGVTPLMLAGRSGTLKAVETLAAHGASLDAKGSNGLPVIGYAALGGNEEVVKFIYEKGGRDLIRHARQDLLFNCAAAGGSKMLAEILLAAGVDVNVRDEAGYTPLLTAIEHDRRELAGFLLERGANRGARTNRGRGLFEVACETGNIALAKEMLASDRGNRAALLNHAAKNGRVELVELLLDQGADVNVPDENGDFPLFWAIFGKTGQHSAVCPAQPASEDDHARTVELLLARGAKVDRTFNQGSTFVHVAALYRGAQVMKVLLKAGENPNLPENSLKKTPLHAAAVGGRVETVLALLDAGADPKAVDIRGDTALHIAADCGNAEVVKLLLGRHVPINTQNQSQGLMPIHNATFANSLECVQILLDAGANPNSRDANNVTPLFIAVDVTARLEQLGSYQTDAGNRYRAMASNKLARLRIIHLLIQSGAKVDSRLTAGGTDHPMSLQQYARDNGTPEIVELLQNPPPVAKRPSRR